MKILIAEDDTISRRFLETQLTKWGYEVASARDGDEAWQLLQSDAPPQVAILDWMMPGVDGLELCRRVRENGSGPYTYLILLTALCGEHNLIAGMDAGADDYLTKPCRGDELRVRLRAGERIIALQHQLTRDLAERKRIEKEREQFRIFFQTSTDLMCIADPNGAFVSVNPALMKTLGYTEAELVARPFIDFIHPDDRQETLDEMVRQLENGCTLDFENRYLAKDASVHWLSWRAVYNNQENCTYATARDITKRKRVEAYAEMSRAILQILNETHDWQDSARKVIATLKSMAGFAAVGLRLEDGADFRYFAQDGFSEDFLLKENSLLERSGDSAPCRDPECFAHSAPCGTPECGVKLACLCGLVISGKGDLAHPCFTPGGSFWTSDSSALAELPPGADPASALRLECVRQGYLSLALVPVRSKDKIIGLIQFSHRSRGEFSVELVQLLEGIAAQVAVALLRKLAEEEQVKLEAQLQQAQKMESVGRLAGGVAHDFNNMLSVIIGYANLALMDLEPAQPLHAHLEEIRKAAERSADLTRQLLAFARKQTVVPKVLDLEQTVAGMLNMLQRIIGEDINLLWQSGGSVWAVKIDPSQIDQILANLCVNARDSIADVGRITIEIGNSVIDEGYCAHNAGVVPGEYVHLVVSDNGCGMDRETQTHIFEPFFTTKGVGEGTGLGLATVYGAVKQNNGFVTVYSEPGLGTAFTIYLPRHAGTVDPVGVAVGAQPVFRGEGTILLVEDESAILDISTMILTRMGYTVLAANSPAEAMQLARDHAGEISLLMTDVVMPEMNGRDLASNLLIEYPHIRRLFMSGYTSDVIAHHGVLDEGVHFIQKPFSMPALAAKVREVFDSDLG
jgi:PAS domain S-box-containing protein